MKLAFLALVWLTSQAVDSTNAMDSSIQDLSSIFDRLSTKMLSSWTVPDISRSKRSVPRESSIVDSGVYRLQSVKPVAVLCSPAIRTLFLDILNETYAVCLREAAYGEPSEVVIGLFKEHSWQPKHRLQVFNAVDVEAFYWKGIIYVLVAENHSSKGIAITKINLGTDEVTSYYIARNKHPTSVVVWEMGNSYAMAGASSVGYKDAPDSRSQVVIYQWKDTYFDVSSEINAYYVTDLEPFQIRDFSFLAIANFQSGKNLPVVDSEIIKYDLDLKTWRSFQKIKTYGAMDWEFFTLGSGFEQEFFLAVANRDSSGNSMIYKFVEDRFQPFQCLITVKAASIASYSQGSTFLLAVANEADAVTLYQYDGWTFVKSIQLSSGAMSFGAVHLAFHRVTRRLESAVVLSVSNPKHPNDQSVFEMVFLYEAALKQWHEQTTEWCYNTLSKTETLDVDKLIGDFEDVIFVDQPSVTINGDVTFDSGFEVETLETKKLTMKSSQEVYDDSILLDLSALQRKLEGLQERLKDLAAILSNSLKIDGSQNVSSRLEFQDVVFDFKNKNSHFPNMFTDKLNGEDITDWAHNFIFTDTDQSIDGTLHFTTLNAPNLNVHGKVDGRAVSSLVTKSGQHTISAKKTFEGSISVPDIRVKGTVDNIEISSNSILLTTGLQRLQGNITFEDVHTQWLKVSNVNGRHFTNFYDDLVFTDKPAIITGHKTFGNIAVDDLTLTPGSKLNGVDLLDLWQNVMWKNGHQTVTAPMILSDVVMEKNVYLSQGLNDIKIPGPRVIDVTENALVTSPTLFDGNTKILSLEVLDSLNNMPLVESPDGQKQLDLLLKTGDQIVSGLKTFRSLHLDADSSVLGHVDGVKLSDLKAMVLRQNSSIVQNGTWVFQNLVVAGPVYVKNRVLGFDLKDIYDRALKTDEANLQKITFSDKIYVEKFISSNINGLDVEKDLVLKNKPQTISGHKKFNQVVIKEDVIVGGLVNNMNLSFFNDYLLRLGNQHLKSKVFKKNVRLSNLIISGSINGVPIADAVTLGGGHLEGSRRLVNVSFTKLAAKKVEVTGKVNGIDLQQLVEDTLTKEGAQTVTGTKQFRNVYVTDGSNLVAKSLNGIDLDQLWADAVFLDRTQQVLGTKTFKDVVEFNELSFDSTLDGVSSWDMQHNWMLKNVNQTVEGKVTFINGFIGNHLTVGELNGHDLGSLVSSIAMLNEETTITGPVIFEKTVTANQGINLRGKLQGVDLSEEIVSRDHIVLTSPKKFHGLVVNDLGVDGKINGISIKDLCDRAILDSTALNTSRLVIRGDLMLMKGGTVSSHLAGVDLKELSKIAVKNDGTLKFSGLKKFSTVSFEGPVVIKGKLGGVNFDELMRNYMSLTKDQEINQQIVFSQLSAKNAFISNFDSTNEEINGLNLKEIDGRVLKSAGQQSITANLHIQKVIFENDVFVAGKVNDLKLPSALMVHNRINYIQSPKRFEKPLVVLGDLELDLGATLQGIDVSGWFKKAVLKTGKFTIQGTKTFQNLDLTDVIANKKFDGLRISEDSLLMTYGNQYVTGKKTIIGDVSMGKLTVDGLINGVDLVKLSNLTLQTNRKNSITGLKRFSRPLTIVSLQAPAITGVDLMKIPEKLQASRNFLHLENRLDEMDGVVSHMKDAFSSQATVFQYYELFEDVGLSAAGWNYLFGKDCGEFLLISDSSSGSACNTVRFLSFDEKLKNFVPSHLELKASSLTSIRTFSFKGLSYVLLMSQNVHLACSNADHIGESTVDIFAWDKDSFKTIQSIKIDKPVDLVVFNDGSQPCFAVLDSSGTAVYCLSDDSKKFVLRETMLTPGAKNLDVIKYDGSIFLVVVSSSREIYLEGQKRLDIYKWDPLKSTFSVPVQFISSTFAQSVSLMKHKTSKGEILFLAVAEENMEEIVTEPKIIIYKYDEAAKLFQKYQVIRDYGTLNWAVLNTGELLLFALDAGKGKTRVFKYSGASGFIEIHSLRNPGTVSLYAFVRPAEKDRLNHYLALEGGNSAKILKSRVKGNPLVY